MTKRPNIQPWLDYFELLGTYEQKGFLETKPDKHEAYITRAALYTLSNTASVHECAKTIFDTARRIRAYAAWQSQTNIDYLSWTFALHVVYEDAPHDPLYTILLSRRRRWWWPFWKMGCVEIIEYSKEKY